MGVGRTYSTLEAKAWAKESLRGYVAALFTPYKADGSIDLGAIEMDVSYTLSLPDIGGVYVGSIYQEYWLLSTSERKAIAEAVVKAVDGKVPVIVSASHTVISEAIVLARHAELIGADLVMLWPPYFGPRGHEGVLKFYEEITASADIGFAFYNTGLAEVGYQMSRDVLSRLADNPKVCLLKEASLRQDVYLDTLALIGDRVLVSSPLEEYWFSGRCIFPKLAPPLLMGSSRCLIMQTPERPRVSAFYQSALNGDLDEATEALRWILEVSEELHGPALRAGYHPVGLLKALRSHLGQSGGDPRPPCPIPSKAEISEGVDVLRKWAII
jgi:4-hydroxy-tetrahydrodipicolinate synthase